LKHTPVKNKNQSVWNINKNPNRISVSWSLARNFSRAGTWNRNRIQATRATGRETGTRTGRCRTSTHTTGKRRQISGRPCGSRTRWSPDSPESKSIDNSPVFWIKTHFCQKIHDRQQNEVDFEPKRVAGVVVFQKRHFCLG